MKIARLLRHLLLPDWSVSRMFPQPALARIEQAIAESEQRHRGQIRFAVEAALHPFWVWRGMTGRDRAVEVFSDLRVWDTELNNGVLIYLLLADHDVEIVADRGVHALAGASRWAAICDQMERELRAGAAERAVLNAITAVSQVLEAHYPPRGGGENELSDQPVVIK